MKKVSVNISLQITPYQIIGITTFELKFGLLTNRIHFKLSEHVQKIKEDVQSGVFASQYII